MDNRKRAIIFGVFFICLVVFELFLFNLDYFFNILSNIEEQKYKISDAQLYQFDLDKGKLVAESNDPNITIADVNQQVENIQIDCDNQVSGAVGQVFYRSIDQDFSESRSIVYDAAQKAPILLDLNGTLDENAPIYSIRFDLTNVANDIVVCNGITLNPHFPPGLNPNRTVIYVVILAALCFYLFGAQVSTFINRFKYGRETAFFCVIEIFQVILFKYLDVPINDHFVFLKLILITTISLLLGFVLSYINYSKFFSFESGDEQERTYWVFFFALLVLITYFPVMSNKYFHHDDYLNFTGLFQNIFPLSVTTGRIGAGLYVDLLYKMTVETSYIGRTIAVIGILLIFFLFNAWMEEIGYGRKISVLLPFLCVVSLPFLNIGAYVMEFSFIWGGLFSALSVVLFLKSWQFRAEKKLLDSFIYLFVSLISIQLSLFIYQATSTLGFGFLVVYLLKNKNSDWKRLFYSFGYYVFFGTSAIVYLILNRLIWAAYGISGTVRAELISNISEVLQKISWFISFVFPQSMRQLLFIFGGQYLFTQEWSLYELLFQNPVLGSAIQIILFFIVLLNFYYRVRDEGNTRSSILYNLLSVIFVFVAIPYSYFYLLVAKENSYLTFYVSGLVFILFAVFVISGQEVIRRFISKPDATWRLFLFFIVPLLVMISFNSNRYLYDLWVRPNDINYNFVKSMLKNNSKSQNIHIIGSTQEVDIYWILAARMALLEMGDDANSYHISYADNEYMINYIEQSKFDRFPPIISKADMDFLSSFYELNASFGFYYVKVNNITQSDLERLKNIFEQLDLIPTQEDHALIIDMRMIK